MTIDDLVQKALAGVLSGELKAEAEAFRERENMTPAVFSDAFARCLVAGYLDGRFDWHFSDNAANVLMGLMSVLYQEFPDYAYGVFLAFDAGEYHPNTPTLTPDEVTRPLINDLVAKHRVA